MCKSTHIQRSQQLTDCLTDWRTDGLTAACLGFSTCHYSSCSDEFAPAKVHNSDDYYALFSAWHLWAALRISFLQSVCSVEGLLLPLLAYVRLFPHWLFVCIRMLAHFFMLPFASHTLGWPCGTVYGAASACMAAWLWVLWQLLINVEVNVNVRQRRSGLVVWIEIYYSALSCVCARHFWATTNSSSSSACTTPAAAILYECVFFYIFMLRLHPSCLLIASRVNCFPAGDLWCAPFFLPVHLRILFTCLNYPLSLAYSHAISPSRLLAHLPDCIRTKFEFLLFEFQSKLLTTLKSDTKAMIRQGSESELKLDRGEEGDQKSILNFHSTTLWNFLKCTWYLLYLIFIYLYDMASGKKRCKWEETDY